MRTRPTRAETAGSNRSGGRAVLLATLGVPFDPVAAEFAVDTAVESGEPLIVANITLLQPLPMSVRLGYDALEEFTPEVAQAVRAPAELAKSLGVHVERLRVRSPRPVQALIQLVDERGPGILVFGPDPRALTQRVYRRALRAIREETACLVWVPEGSATSPRS